MSGMIGWKPSTTKVFGSVSDSCRYCLQSISGTRSPQRWPISPTSSGARVPVPWQASQPPAPK